MRHNRAPYWSDAEDRVVYRYWPRLDVSIGEISKLLPRRNKEQVARRARRLGLPSRDCAICLGTERWTEEEKETLRCMTMDGADPEDIAAALPERTDAAIAKKQRAMKLITPRPTVTPLRFPVGPLPRRVSGEPCCFPMGEPGTPSFRYCDEPALAGCAYCGEHDDLTHIRAPQSDQPSTAVT